MPIQINLKAHLCLARHHRDVSLNRGCALWIVFFVMPRYIFRYNFIRQLLDFRRAVGAALAEFFGFRRPQQTNFLGVSLLRFLIVEKHIKKQYFTSVLPPL
jgi:hypothetical protein